MNYAYDRALGEIARELSQRVARLAPALDGAAQAAPAINLNPTRDASHGDFATPVALAAAKMWKGDPYEIAQGVAAQGSDGMPAVAHVDAVRPGYVNLTMGVPFWAEVVRDVLRMGPDYGRSTELQDAGPLVIEFVSANPTGPLVVVQGRSSALGATLSEMMRFAGCAVTAETYVNDAGAQLEALAGSVYARYATLLGRETALPDNGYPGSYIVDIARKLIERDGPRWLDAPFEERHSAIGRFARDLIVDEQREDLDRFRVHFDRWTSEAALHDSGAIALAMDELRASGHTFERDGALWLRATDFGDDKDRVLLRSDGRPTYLAADAAYHADKLRRGHRYLLNILGPDHHGYILRLKALVAAMGHPGSLEVLLAQHVTFKRAGETVSMSKRAGDLVTLREVMDQVGVDAARYFFIDRAPESHLVFDMELAIEQSAKNPVYYVQYGHARIASILRRAEGDGKSPLLERGRAGADLDRLEHKAEIALIRRIADFRRTVAAAARARAPHRLAEYAHAVATDFHGFYTDCLVLSDNDALTSARLSLCLAAKTVLASALRLIGVSAPEKM